MGNKRNHTGAITKKTKFRKRNGLRLAEFNRLRMECTKNLDKYDSLDNVSAMENVNLADCTYEESPRMNVSESTAEVPEYEIEDRVEDKSLKVEGRRIVDILHLFEQMQQISDHGPFECTLKNLQLVSEKRIGLVSLFSFRCNMCNAKFRISTDKSDKDISKKFIDINNAAVSGIFSVGSGFSHLEEVLSSMEIPCMSSKLYSNIHANVADKWQETAVDAMENAANREKEAAFQEGRIDKNGVPMVDVIADGCWSKRSYGKNYSALSGAAAIVGRKFGEVLFMAVRNKYCCICARSEKKKQVVPDHKCYKNFTGSSTSMEADILVEGFKKSVEMYGIIYSKIISDGDSSSYQRLLQSRPYPNHTIEKIECKNHILRNFCNKLKLVAVDTKYKLHMRKLLTTERILSMRKVICLSIKYNKTLNIPFSEKIDMLYKDIMNAPLHSYGCHQDCKRVYCNNDNDCNRFSFDINKVREDLIWQRITYITSCVAIHARSLIHDAESNVVERFNGIIAKFVGGKRINYSMKQSYQARCNAAVVSFNTKMPLTTLQKKFLCKSPKGLANKFELKKLKRHNASRKYLRKKNRLLRIQTTDTDYGENCAQPDMPIHIYEIKKQSLFKELEERKNDKVRIEKLTVLQGESSEWLELRRNMLTASHFGKIINRLEYTSCSNQVKSMLYPKNLSHVSSICHGKENEKHALEQLSLQEGITIKPCGLFIDSSIPYLGATPDGLSGDMIIEIKCPITAFNLRLDEAIRLRKVTFWNLKNGKLEVNTKHNWYIQIQGQLHITGRNKCLFADWSGREVPIKTEYIMKDDDFWINVMEKKLKNFYMNCLLPEIIDPRMRRNMKIRDPQYILDAISKRETNAKTNKLTNLVRRRLNFQPLVGNIPSETNSQNVGAVGENRESAIVTEEALVESSIV